MLQIEPLGDRALIIQFSDELSIDVEEQIAHFQKLLESSAIEGLVEYIPAYTTVTIFYDPACSSLRNADSPFHLFKKEILNLLKQTKTIKRNQYKKIIEIPVCYGGEYGPDLKEVARLHSKTVEEVIFLHTNEIYNVSMIGFAPGFPYLSGLNEAIRTPRLKTPRKKVNQGSVGIAGIQTGIYSIDSPGGWQIIGRTPVKLFNYQDKNPSLLKHGDKVKFVRVNGEQFKHLEEKMTDGNRS